MGSLRLNTATPEYPFFTVEADHQECQPSGSR